MIWDGYLYVLCFIHRNYTIRLGGGGKGGIRREMKMAKRKTERRKAGKRSKVRKRRAEGRSL